MFAFLKRHTGLWEAFNRVLWYGDVLRCEGVPKALETALREIGSDLPVASAEVRRFLLAEAQEQYREYWEAGYRPWLHKIPMSATVGPKSRQVRITTEDYPRLFRIDCWSRGACLAEGATRSLGAVARATDRWVAGGCTASTLASEFRFVHTHPDADVYERGEELEFTWQKYLSEAEHRMTTGEHWEWEHWSEEFVIAAGRRRQLRQLFPLVSGHAVVFSRCTRKPFTYDTPLVTYGYRNRGRSFEYAISVDGEVIGVGDAEYAADLVVRHLPEACGPALVGTAEDLARQIAEREETTVEEVLRRLRAMVEIALCGQSKSSEDSDAARSPEKSTRCRSRLP